MSHQNYFSWRQAVVDSALEQGVSMEVIAAQRAQVFQEQYFEQAYSVDDAVAQLKFSGVSSPLDELA